MAPEESNHWSDGQCNIDCCVTTQAELFADQHTAELSRIVGQASVWSRRLVRVAGF